MTGLAPAIHGVFDSYDADIKRLEAEVVRLNGLAAHYEFMLLRASDDFDFVASIAPNEAAVRHVCEAGKQRVKFQHEAKP